MDADWYVDPLGRFDGRFFDGEDWTERVSDDGASTIDPDFPPIGDGSLGVAAPAPDQSGLEPPSETPVPAVSQAFTERRLQASLMEESPVRTVAVLDTAFGSPFEGPGRSRGPIVWGLLGLIAALVVAGLLLWNRDRSDVVADPVQLDQEQEERVHDLEEGGAGEDFETQDIEELEVDAPVGVVDPGSTFAASETIGVGGLRILNGTSVLADLESWHQEFAAQRGIELDSRAGCWFGQLGGAAVQVAHCGPVGGSADTELRFDAVPLLFEEADGGQIAQPVVDAVTESTVLANALTLVGNPDNPSPLSLADD